MIRQRFEVIRKMSALNRFSQTHLVKPENVLEHTGFVCLFSAFLCEDLVDAGNNINIKSVMFKAVFHDMDEIITGDIPRPTKYANSEIQKAIEGVSQENMSAICKDINSESAFYYWNNSKSADTGIIVAVSDMAAIVYKAWQEAELYGNKTIVDHMTLIPGLIEDARSRSHLAFKYPKPMLDALDEIENICNSIMEKK